MNKERKCKYRNCDKTLTDIDHGNREYCSPKEGEPYKLSCKAKEQRLVKLEVEKEKDEKNKRILKLKTILNFLELDQGEKCIISVDFFLNYLEEHIGLFERETYQSMRGSAVKYCFENFSICKVNVSGVYELEITKNTSDEK